jgi:hypothetical protein
MSNLDRWQSRSLETNISETHDYAAESIEKMINLLERIFFVLIDTTTT